jgi:hypothetical protein
MVKMCIQEEEANREKSQTCQMGDGAPVRNNTSNAIWLSFVVCSVILLTVLQAKNGNMPMEVL